MNIDDIRGDFPSLGNEKNIYFDNACMSLKPRQVVEAMQEYYYQYPACAGRSNHHFGEIVSKKIVEARRIVAGFLNADENEIVFLRNTTEGLNLVARSLDLKKGDVVLTTDREHNSNLIVWQQLAAEKGIVHKVVPSKDDNAFDLAGFAGMLSAEVKVVSMVLTSNLDGVSIPVEEIIKLAHANGSLVVIDAAQAAPHRKIDVKKLDVDFLAFSGHKMCGPTGTGVLFIKERHFGSLKPYNVGGDTVEYSTYTDHKMLAGPHKFEAGLQDYAGIIGLGAACRYIEKLGFDFIERQTAELNEYVTREIGGMKGMRVIGPADSGLRGGIFSFNIEGIDYHQVSLLLNNMSGIMVRSGQHCVHSWFAAHGIKGSVRASFYFYNTLDEAKVFVDAVRKIALLG